MVVSPPPQAARRTVEPMAVPPTSRLASLRKSLLDIPEHPKIGVSPSPLIPTYNSHDFIDTIIPGIIGDANMDYIRENSGIERARLKIVLIRDIHFSFKAFDIFKKTSSPTILAIQSSHSISYFQFRTGKEGNSTVFFVFPQLFVIGNEE